MTDGSISSRHRVRDNPSPGDVSNSNPPLSALASILLPSISDVIFVSLLALLLCSPLAVRLLGDAGIGWHIRTGQQILATHSIPRVDSFSSTMAGRPWFAWEWLYDVSVGLLDRWAELNGVVLLTALIIATVFAANFRFLVRGRATGVLVALMLVLLAAGASMIHFLARPHVFSWLFTLIWFLILDFSRSDCSSSKGASARERILWFLPLLMVIWVNVHGGFLVGFVLLGIYWADATQAWLASPDYRLDDLLRRLRARRRTRSLTLISALCLAASFINPYGWNLQLHIYRYLSDTFLMDHIDEFQSPNFHGIAQKCFASLILITLVAFAAKQRGLRLREILISLFAVASGLYASRNIPVSSILLVIVTGPLLSETLNARRGRRSRLGEFASRMGKIESQIRGWTWSALAAGIAVVVVFSGGSHMADAHFDGKRFPMAAVNYLQANDLKPLARTNTTKNAPAATILSPDYWGGYLIYRLYPKAQVAVDDRHDLYGSDFFKSYLKMIHVEPGWEAILDSQRANYLLLPKDTPLAYAVRKSAAWKVIYSDDVAMAFLRHEP